MSAIQREFQRQKEWIAACDDPQEVLDKMTEYREAQRAAIRSGNALGRARCADLLELAEDRVVELKAAKIAAEEQRNTARRAPVAALPPAAPERQRVRAEEAERRHDQEREQARRASDERARGAAAEERAAAIRLANAQAAEVEARAELLRAQARAAAKPVGTAPVATRVEMREAAAPGNGRERREPPTAPVAPKPVAARRVEASVPAPRAAAAEYSAADQLALASVGHWPPTPPERRGAFWTRDTDWPANWTLTGYDLAIFRGRVSVTRAVLAGQLGVDAAALVQAESRPKEKIGPALQIALKRAIEVVQEQRRRRKMEVGAEAAAVPPVAERLPVAREPMAVPVGATAAASTPVPPMPNVAVRYTGADVARVRHDRGLSQRELAALLGIGHGMVGKAELAPTKALGEGMQAAFARVALPGGATR